jgi:nitric oxide reductase large subunit
MLVSRSVPDEPEREYTTVKFSLWRSGLKPEESPYTAAFRADEGITNSSATNSIRIQVFLVIFNLTIVSLRLVYMANI